MKIFLFLRQSQLETPRFLKFQFKWFSSYSCLANSAIDNGAFFKYSAEINNQLLGSLVLKKYDNWNLETYIRVF